MSYLGENIRKLRKERGLTVSELAKLSKASAASISQIENGKRDATFKLILSIAHGLGIEVGELVTPINQNHFKHDIKSVIKFSENLNLIIGISENTKSNKIFWIGVFDLHKDAEIVDLIHVEHNIEGDFQFKDFFETHLNPYLVQQRLRILLWKCLEVHKPFLEVKKEGIKWDLLKDLIIHLNKTK
jgi:transcriptional regulator with XRE-family HTH domain